MAGDSSPIDIVVTDSVASTITTKLLAIAQAALNGADAVDTLNNTLAKLNVNAVSQLTSAQSQLEKQTNANNLAYLNQEAALNRAIAAESKAATAAIQLQAAQAKAATAAQAVADASDAASASVNAFGESEAAVASRLASVASAGASLAKQQQAITITASEATAAQNTLSRATVAAGASAATAAQRYSGYMSALNTLQKNPAASQTANPQATAAGMAAITPAAQAAQGATAGVTRELIVLGHEAISGNFSRIPGSLLVLAERTGGFAAALETLAAVLTSPIGLLVIFAAAAVAVAAAMIAAQEAMNKFNNAATLTGNIAGLTADSYNELAKSVASANNVTISSTKDVISALQSSGVFNNQEVQQLSDSAVKLSKLTGESTDKIVQDFTRAAQAPAQYASELQRTTDLITPLQAAQIKQLQDMGQTAQATQLLSEDLYTSLQTHAPAALTGLLGFWTQLKNGIVDATTEVGNFFRVLSGGATVTEKLDATSTSISVLQAGLNGLKAIGAGSGGAANFLSGLIDIQQGKIDALQQAGQATQAIADAQSAAKQSANATAAALDTLGAKFNFARGNTVAMNQALTTFQNTLKTLNADPTTKNLPQVQFATANQASIEQQIRDQFRAPTTVNDSREKIIEKTNAQLDSQLAVYGQISDARKAQEALDKVDIQLQALRVKGQRAAPLSDAEKATIIAKEQQIIVNQRVEASEDAIYTTAIGPLRTYNDGVTALTILNAKHLLTTQQVTEAQKALDFAYQSATDPLFQFNKQMTEQNALLESNADANQRAAQAQVNSINNTLAPKGKSLTQAQTDSVLQQVAAQQQLNLVTQQYDAIIAANKGAYDALDIQQAALNKALDAGVISLDNYATKTTQLAIARAQLRVDTGVGTQDDLGLASVGKLLDGYKNVLSSLTTGFQSFFSTIESGFADAIGHALVFGGSLKDALGAVAQQAVAGLISSLVKLGIQYVINAELGQSVGATALATQTTASVAAAVTTAAAWAPAAAAVSLASFGANASGALTGISAAYALTDILSLPGLQAGGYTGDAPVGAVAGVVHGQEFVVNAAGTAANRSTLEAINRGSSSAGSGGAIKISVQNTGTPQTYSAQQIGPSEIRLIAADAAKQEIANDGGKTAAAALSNPNSRFSKSVAQNLQVTRSRGGS